MPTRAEIDQQVAAITEDSREARQALKALIWIAEAGIVDEPPELRGHTKKRPRVYPPRFNYRDWSQRTQQLTRFGLIRLVPPTGYELTDLGRAVLEERDGGTTRVPHVPGPRRRNPEGVNGDLVRRLKF